MEFEQVLLRTIDFKVDPPDPYRLLLNYARSLRLGRAATRTAWGLVNDVLFCPRALSAPPQAVACAAIRIATRVHGTDRRLRWFSPPCNKRRKRTVLETREGSAAGMGIDQHVQGDATHVAEGTPTTSQTPSGQEMPKMNNLSAAGDASSSGDIDAEKRSDGAWEAVRQDHSGSNKNGGGGEEQLGMPWWGLFGAQDGEVELVCSELLALYRGHRQRDDPGDGLITSPVPASEGSESGGARSRRAGEASFVSAEKVPRPAPTSSQESSAPL